MLATYIGDNVSMVTPGRVCHGVGEPRIAHTAPNPESLTPDVTVRHVLKKSAMVLGSREPSRGRTEAGDIWAVRREGLNRNNVSRPPQQSMARPPYPDSVRTPPTMLPWLEDQSTSGTTHPTTRSKASTDNRLLGTSRLHSSMFDSSTRAWSARANRYPSLTGLASIYSKNTVHGHPLVSRKVCQISRLGTAPSLSASGEGTSVNGILDRSTSSSQIDCAPFMNAIKCRLREHLDNRLKFNHDNPVKHLRLTHANVHHQRPQGGVNLTSPGYIKNGTYGIGSDQNEGLYSCDDDERNVIVDSQTCSPKSILKTNEVKGHLNSPGDHIDCTVATSTRDNRNESARIHSASKVRLTSSNTNGQKNNLNLGRSTKSASNDKRLMEGSFECSFEHSIPKTGDVQREALSETSCRAALNGSASVAKKKSVHFRSGHQIKEFTPWDPI